MKKIFTTIVLMAAMLVAIPAKAGINFGIKGGYNITNFSFSEDVIAKDNQQGFFIGPSLKIGIPVLPIGFEIAALYDQRDAKLEGEKISQKSINIPINVRYELGLGDMAGIYVAAGPQFGFNIGDKKFSFSNATQVNFSTLGITASDVSDHLPVVATITRRDNQNQYSIQSDIELQ